MMRRGIIASDAQRKPGGALSVNERDDVELLLQRLARRDATRRTSVPRVLGLDLSGRRWNRSWGLRGLAT